MALNYVATSWAAREPAEAERWVRGLDAGAERDRAIDGYLTATAASGFNTRLLEQYSSDAAREQGAGRAILEIGKTNLPEARRLLDRYITTETLRRQIEANLSSIHVLEAEWSYLNDPLRLADLARRHTDLLPTTPNQIGDIANLPPRQADQPLTPPELTPEGTAPLLSSATPQDIAPEDPQPQQKPAAPQPSVQVPAAPIVPNRAKRVGMIRPSQRS